MYVEHLITILLPVYGYSGFLHQYKCPPRYTYFIDESGAKHHKPNLNLSHVRSRLTNVTMVLH